MAVIESKGDGYSLFNGVKLPSLPEITNEWLEEHDFGTPEEWDLTEFPEFKYSVIFNEDDERILAFISARQFNVDFDVSPPEIWLGDNEYGFLDILQFELEDGNWRFLLSDVSTIWRFFKLLWSNYDIINTTDNSVYLAASDPIPLDGMNVIEWDGDTTGLEVFPNSPTYVRVSNATDIDVSKEIIAVRHSYVDGTRTSYVSTLVEKTGYFTRSSVARYVEAPSEAYPLTGVYPYRSEGALFVETFAYYPIETGGEEVSKGKAFLLHKMFSKPIAHAMTKKWFWFE